MQSCLVSKRALESPLPAWGSKGLVYADWFQNIRQRPLACGDHMHAATMATANVEIGGKLKHLLHDCMALCWGSVETTSRDISLLATE